MTSRSSRINTEVYHELGERWYTAQDDPIALLRAEAHLLAPWIAHELSQRFDHSALLLDVGCGGGFHSNALAARGYRVTGIDLSEESLQVAARHDPTRAVRYLKADAQSLSFADGTFDAAICMDFLEHVEDPSKVIGEISRILKPDGLFFFHTFNRNPLSGLVVIKLVEWLLKNTPENLHLYRLFIKPQELARHCLSHHLTPVHMRGIRPKIESAAFVRSLLKRRVEEDFSFTFTSSLAISYAGVARKTDFAQKPVPSALS